MGSSRLPGKVLMDVAGQTVLERTVGRAKRAKTLDQIVIATTRQTGDEAIVAEAQRLGVECLRGSETDVLSRYHSAFQAFHADALVRITSDCPLIDPAVIDLVVTAFRACNPPPDYASNTFERTYPRGLDVEIFGAEAFERVVRDAKAAYEREHVTPRFYQNPQEYRLLAVTNPTDYSTLRWTVDTPEDLEFVRQVCRRLGEDETFSWQDVLALLEQDPSLIDINQHIEQKPL